MLRNTLSTWNKTRLRFILIVFFFALAIPAAILIKQAYSQLKWEAFHHYRLQAEELTKRIDTRFMEFVEIESARSFTDYSFLNVAGTSKSNFIQRSPLSTFPVDSKFPGIIGYFQVDNLGQFTSPLLPSSLSEQYSDNENYDISSNEKIERKKIHNQIYQILSKNKLVNKPSLQITQSKTVQPSVTGKPATLSRSSSQEQKTAPLKDIQQRDDKDKKLALSEKDIITEIEKPESSNLAPQAAFDDLQSRQGYSLEQTIDTSENSSLVENLKLKKDYQEKLKETNKQLKSTLVKKEKRNLRIESNVLPAFPAAAKKRKNKYRKKNSRLRVNMFESEIDAFEFSRLESGHFVLYRKVWRNGQRYIQGLMIKPDFFIENVISKSFYKTSVSNATNLTVAYKGNILSTLHNMSSDQSYSGTRILKGNENLQGTLLLQKKLSTTLDQIELIFSINNLPAGPGAVVINWLSIILLLILCGGFFILYVLGLKQLTLARQQQDFVSAVSHELKTPLTSIRMYGEMLREGWVTEEKRKTYYDYIYDESERLTRLINNVLQLARMTRNELPVDLKPYTVAELVDTVRSKISSQVERAEFKLNLICDEAITKKTLLVDVDYFTQIIINLVDNAIKFSAKSEKRQIDIQCQILRNNKIQFTIRDYGPGVNKDQMRKIFHLFYRSENELTRDTVGTGIGLSLVKQLVNSMQGEIDVVNKEPGVEFQITFNAI